MLASVVFMSPPFSLLLASHSTHDAGCVGNPSIYNLQAKRFTFEMQKARELGVEVAEMGRTADSKEGRRCVVRVCVCV